jgi:predicted glutamine amidotransferase
MCRLFGMSAVPQRVRATFWLLDAEDSLAVQSRRQPDGVGLGIFEPDGTPQVHKLPVAAYADAEFAREARELSAATFIAHIRYATTGGHTMANTHPFCQQGRLFAHNGTIGDLPRLEAELGNTMGLVTGDTDSERLFALITRYEQDTGDVGAAITRAVRWVADNVPVRAVNLVLTTPTELWALRYPDTHPLWVLVRAAGAVSGRGPLEVASPTGELRVRCGDLTDEPATVLASVPMDDDPGWRLLDPGELLVVDTPISHRSLYPFDKPAHPLTSADLTSAEAVSQASYIPSGQQP